MSFSSNKIIIFVFILLTSMQLMAIDNGNKILNDFNYTYNIADIKLAKSSHDSWERGKEYGYFTAIAYRDGFDHGFEIVRVLINKVKTFKNGTADMMVIKDIQIDTPGIAGYIEDMRLDVINNKLSLGLDIRKREEPNFIVKQNIMIDLEGNVTNLIPFDTPLSPTESFYK